MHEYVYFNEQISRAGDAFLPAVSAAALYGQGIFTTAAIYHSEPFLWDKHWHRLQNNAEKLGVDLSAFPEETVRGALGEIIEKNKIVNGRARLTFFDEQAGGIWHYETDRRTSFLITSADFRQIAGEFRLTVSPFAVVSNSPLANVKSCSYTENILAFDAAKRQNFDEAVRLNERGEIVSACLANIFWLKNGRLFTPAIGTGCLNGTTRQFLTENYDCPEVFGNTTVLDEAEAVFLTSAGIGIVQVSEFNGKKFAEKFAEITGIIKK